MDGRVLRVRKTDSGRKGNLFAVVMAGGKGTRFWPLSREALPKQFLKLVGKRTLLQDTIHRLQGEVDPANMLVLITEAQKNIVQWQAAEICGDANVNTIVEPEGRNTAPAIALAAYKIHKKRKDAMMLVLPSDHYISDGALFIDALRRALPVAAGGSIVTFGIEPTRPETGFGYMKTGKKLSDGAFKVARFVEKPDLKTARTYLREGTYYWNSGIFLFRAGDMIEEFRRYMPEMHNAFNSIHRKLNTGKEGEALGKIYPTLEEESIDYGIMEKSRKAAMVVAGFPWSDIGSWSALDEVMEKNRDGNVLMGNMVGVDCKDSIFFTGDKLVAAIGLEGMVVVDTADATLITPKDKVQRVKDLVAKLKLEGKEEYLAPSFEDRPWGYFSVLEQGMTHKIKHIFIKPRARLSVQMHNHRSEHWIVVSGTARVLRGEETFFVHQNESTFIPATVKHSLENPGKIPLRIIEIQSGEYLGEDDIIRFDDIYKRDTV
jgi:mannose-1-phosphate guanylyltransferase/mannose-6-phosphate isomerase